MLRRVLALSLMGLATAACSKAAATPAERIVHVRIHYSAFSLGHLDVAPGEIVRFVVTNTDPIDHEFIVGDQDLLFGCHLPGHYAYGMRGTISVG